MKKIILIKIMFLAFIFEMSGQGYRSNILRQNNDSVLRIAIVDSLVNESFWDTEASYMKWYRDYYRKTDFSENAKKKLLSYYNRTLPDYEIEDCRESAKFTINFDVEKMRLDAEKKGLDYDSMYNAALKKQIIENIEIVSTRAYSRISPLYARLLGWLDYKPTIPILESIIKDSLNNKEYARDNKNELETSCKLALARMGNQKYESELIDFYSIMDLNCNDEKYRIAITNLLYINTHKSINLIVKLSDTDTLMSKPYMLGMMSECFPKKVNLLYLATVIKNYPIEFGDMEDIKDFILQDPYLYEYEPIFESQYDFLLQWLKQNKNTYQINIEKLFLP